MRGGCNWERLGQSTLLVILLVANAAGGWNDEEFFETRIRPLLAESCIGCHGPDVASGGLRLDTRDGLLAGGDSGPAVSGDDALASLLIRAIRKEQDADIQMPPEETLSPEAIRDLTRWIERGVPWPKSHATPIDNAKPHWAFQPLQDVSLPDDPRGWAKQPIDRFIARAQAQHGVAPVPPASKATLLRRAYFDLIGLPPSPEQLRAFLADESPNAFAKVVDDLLNSPRYGERWGRHWLDLVRYADTAGDNADYPIPQAYLYRDYVIDAFNADMPFDRFLHEQLAGDILAQDAPASDYGRLVTATGFIAQAKRMGTRELEDMHLIIEDTLSTFGQAVMGLSFRCARCHDHKFDPLTMQDYYALYGIFASTQYPFAGAEEVRHQTHFAPLLPPAEIQGLLTDKENKLSALKAQLETLVNDSDLSRNIAQLEQQLADLDRQREQASEAAALELRLQRDGLSIKLDEQRQALDQETKHLQETLQQLESQDPLADVPRAYAVGERQPVDVGVQVNGNPHAPSQPPVPRGVPKILDQQPLQIPSGSSGRLELAQWLTSRGSYLTARVMVNRIWQYHFGKPLVATPSDFGFRGTPPTHPDLLDWLAGEFITSGWSVKSLHRKMMLSQVYQLSTTRDEDNAQVDSANAWYWRFDRRRLDAESLRDAVLMLSGTLDLGRPGPHPFPEPSKWRYTAHHQFNDVCYPSDHRSVYLMVQRLHAHPYLSLFGGADPSLTTPTRDQSTVPQQALYLINNKFMHAQSLKFSQRLVATHDDVRARIKSAYVQVFGREASEVEVARVRAFLQRYEKSFENEAVPNEHVERESWAALARTLLASNEFFYVD